VNFSNEKHLENSARNVSLNVVLPLFVLLLKLRHFILRGFFQYEKERERHQSGRGEGEKLCVWLALFA
jgi:hypothetical protein